MFHQYYMHSDVCSRLIPQLHYIVSSMVNINHVFASRLHLLSGVIELHYFTRVEKKTHTDRTITDFDGNSSRFTSNVQAVASELRKKIQDWSC